MEYTALLAGHRFNDHPTSTHPALAELARQVNDRLSDESRSQLITRAPALAATGPGRPGVASAVAAAALGVHERLAPASLVLPWNRRRLARLRARDGAVRSWWGRHRDTNTARQLTWAALDRLQHAVPSATARDRVLLRLLDRALADCACAPTPLPLCTGQVDTTGPRR